MTAKVKMEQVKLDKFNFKGMKSTESQSTTYVLIQSFIKQLTLVVKQCFFYACNKSNHLQLRPEAAIMLEFLRCLGNVTSWITIFLFDKIEGRTLAVRSAVTWKAGRTNFIYNSLK